MNRAGARNPVNLATVTHDQNPATGAIDANEQSTDEFNEQMRIRLDTNQVDPLYAFYWFSSPWMVQLFSSATLAPQCRSSIYQFFAAYLFLYHRSPNNAPSPISSARSTTRST